MFILLKKEVCGSHEQCTGPTKCEKPRPRPVFYRMLGQTHVNGWSRIVASQNGGLTSYIFPPKLGVLQWSRHLFNYLDK